MARVTRVIWSFCFSCTGTYTNHHIPCESSHGWLSKSLRATDFDLCTNFGIPSYFWINFFFRSSLTTAARVGPLRTEVTSCYSFAQKSPEPLQRSWRCLSDPLAVHFPLSFSVTATLISFLSLKHIRSQAVPGCSLSGIVSSQLCLIPSHPSPPLQLPPSQWGLPSHPI